jgi:transposase InsO family protein
MNVDLCFVPATHEAEQKLPAVSGSSGRLVVEQPKEEEPERQWPGKVFEDESLDYTEAMLKFVTASQEQPEPTPGVEADEKAALKDRKRALRQEEMQLQYERRTVRQQRKHEDAAWKAFKAERKQQKDKRGNLSRQERKAQNERWQFIRQQRRETQRKRKVEDQEWRQKRNRFREIWSQLPIVTAWIAILVITDNCTRQCVGLPLFVAGSKVTADMIVEALKVLLPPDLLFLISDRGTHFTAKAFRVLIRSEEFIHVLIARHRPQSNGIAERFVRTIKEWLKDKNWDDDRELSVLLEQFLVEYNDRPHQGLAIPGLSPNEFANRIWLF